MSSDKSKDYQSGTKNDKGSTNIPTTYLNFSFYKVDSKWRWLNDIGKDEAAKEFCR